MAIALILLILSLALNAYFYGVMMPEYDRIIKDVRIFLDEDNNPTVTTVSESIFLDELEEMKLLKKAMQKNKREYPENVAGGWQTLAQSNKNDYARDARRYNELARKVAKRTPQVTEEMENTVWPGTN